MVELLDGVIRIELTARNHEELKRLRWNLIKKFGERVVNLEPKLEEGGFYTDSYGNDSAYILISTEEITEGEVPSSEDWEKCTCRWAVNCKVSFDCPVHGNKS